MLTPRGNEMFIMHVVEIPEKHSKGLSASQTCFDGASKGDLLGDFILLRWRGSASISASMGLVWLQSHSDI